MSNTLKNGIIILGLVITIALLVTILSKGRFTAGAQSTAYKKAPEFHQTEADQWLNSEPLTLAGLRGKVVMIDFWTFGCWNCYRSFPWMNEMEARLKDQDFTIIGVHTPEFKHEKVRANIEAKIVEFELQHPTVMDNDFRYWKAMNNRYWPSYYLIDKKGFIRKNFIGETHADTPKALEIETTIRQLLSEPS